MMNNMTFVGEEVMGRKNYKKKERKHMDPNPYIPFLMSRLYLLSEDMH